MSYAFPLPVKKLVTFDLNGDETAEIICEIGGRESGGGIVVLGLRDGELQRVVNSGLSTYKDDQFVGMWGAFIDDDPRLVIYS